MAVVAASAVVLAGAGVAASSVIKSPAQAAAEAGPPPEDVLIATVERRVLQETVVLRGAVTAGQSVQVNPTGGGREGAAKSVVTKMSVKVGDTVKKGQALLEVSGRPVFALKGDLPVYRDLKPGATGNDVKQLQQALRSMGHGSGSDAAGMFGPGTKKALKAFYASLGYDPLPAQADGGAAVTAAEEAVSSAERALEDTRDALDTATGSEAAVDTETQGADGKAADADGGTGGRSAGGGGADAQKAVERAEEDLAKAREDLAETRAADGPMLPSSEVVFLEGFPARVDAVQARVGTEVSGSVMTVSAGALVVHGYLQEHQKGMVRPGQKVEILSEASGITASGKVLSVADSVDSGPGGQSSQQDGQSRGEDDAGGASSGGARGHLMIVEPDKPLSTELAGQDVRLTIEAASTDGKALVVPVTAISAGADGKTVVTVVSGTGKQRRVQVRPGTTGDGFVEVTPVADGELAEGDNVVTGVNPGTQDRTAQ
ncbi:peptidoglycan-binding protein [Streptomyces sp. NPDC019443]|uniref:peptidoglycan-binding protein n=1 Tax=Streptomyces sp. NPDC019443 TaxID=3365061 RepID=UPI0037AFE27A